MNKRQQMKHMSLWSCPVTKHELKVYLYKLWKRYHLHPGLHQMLLAGSYVSWRYADSFQNRSDYKSTGLICWMEKRHVSD